MPCVDGDSFVAYTTLHHLHKPLIRVLCPRSPSVIPSSASPAQPSQVGQVVQQAGHHHQAPLLGAGSHQRLSAVQALVKQARLSASGGQQAVGKWVCSCAPACASSLALHQQLVGLVVWPEQPTLKQRSNSGQADNGLLMLCRSLLKHTSAGNPQSAPAPEAAADTPLPLPLLPPPRPPPPCTPPPLAHPHQHRPLHHHPLPPLHCRQPALPPALPHGPPRHGRRRLRARADNMDVQWLSGCCGLG